MMKSLSRLFGFCRASCVIFACAILLVLFTTSASHARIHWQAKNTFEVSNVRIDRPDERWRVIEKEAPDLVCMVHFKNGKDTTMNLSWQPPLDARLTAKKGRGKSFTNELKKYLLQEWTQNGSSVTRFEIVDSWIFAELEGPQTQHLAAFRFTSNTLKQPFVKIVMETQKLDKYLINAMTKVENSLQILP